MIKAKDGRRSKNESILVSGVSGSGKSTVCNELQRRGCKAYDIEEMRGLFRQIDKKTRKDVLTDWEDLESFKQRAWVCDENKLRRLVCKNKARPAFYCGIASNLDQLVPMFDKVLVLRVSSKAIRERLRDRTTKPSGLAFCEWVLSWKRGWEKWMIEKGAIVINANQTLQKVVDDVLKAQKLSRSTGNQKQPRRHVFRFPYIRGERN